MAGFWHLPCRQKTRAVNVLIPPTPKGGVFTVFLIFLHRAWDCPICCVGFSFFGCSYPHFSIYFVGIFVAHLLHICCLFAIIFVSLSIILIIINMSLRSIISSFPLVGFSGSRSCHLAVGAARSVFPFVYGPVVTGCATGVDFAVRSAFPGASVFSASSFPASSFSGRLALRSAALVRSVVAGSGLLVVCPAGACPTSVAPSSVFAGSGSGSWGSAAFAVGLGGAVLVCVPTGAVAPRWLVARSVSSFGCPVTGGTWFFVPSVPPLSLF